MATRSKNSRKDRRAGEALAGQWTVLRKGDQVWVVELVRPEAANYFVCRGYLVGGTGKRWHLPLGLRELRPQGFYGSEAAVLKWFHLDPTPETGAEEVLDYIQGNEIPPGQQTPVVRLERGWVIVATDWHEIRGDSYDIRLTRIATPLQLLGWVHHLSSKTWFDSDVAGDLIDVVCRHWGWKFHGA
jgi:hypothetical protein